MTEIGLYFLGSIMNPFDFVNSITYSKTDIMNDINEKEYAPFLVNRSLSYHQDTLLYANEMNRLHHASKHMQFSFYLNSIKSRKRFSKWLKSSKIKDLDVVKQHFGYSNKKAQEALSLMTKKQIDYIKERLYKGGRK